MISDYKDSADTKATGHVATVSQEIGRAETSTEVEWVERGQGLPVTVRWLLERQIDRQYPAARMVCDLDDERFSRLIHLGSRAAKQVKTLGSTLVTTFLQHVSLGVFPKDPVQVGPVSYDIDKKETFNNSIHPAYSGLNKLERECALVPFAGNGSARSVSVSRSHHARCSVPNMRRNFQLAVLAIDALGWPWYRNPQSGNGGFALPRFEPGSSRKFYPDFIILTDATIWLMDTKGDHLIQSDAGRKLIAVDPAPGSQQSLKVCFITQGSWDHCYNKLNDDGVTTWRLRAGQVNNPEHYADMNRLLKKIVAIKKD